MVEFASRLDLNLLPHLAALLTERSVSRAAERLRLSQPSMSAALSRLRIHFDDPLLVRRGHAYELSPLAARIVDQVCATVESARRILEEQGEWDPSTADREFAVSMSDYALCTIGPIAARIASAEAPGVRFRFSLQQAAIVDEAEERLRAIDALIAPHGMVADLPFLDLWQDEWVVVADADNAVVARGLTLDDLATSPMVHPFQSRTSPTPASRQLQYLGIESRTALAVESFLAVPLFVRGTSRLGLVQRGMLASLPPLDGIVAMAPPVALAPLTNALWWHPRHVGDAAHAWMRALFVRAAEMHQEQASEPMTI